VLDLGKEIKKNVQNDNMLAWQYNTVGVSDGITMGGEGMSSLLSCGFQCAD
jgi:dihydroxy-acid dehydratase